MLKNYISGNKAKDTIVIHYINNNHFTLLYENNVRKDNKNIEKSENEIIKNKKNCEILLTNKNAIKLQINKKIIILKKWTCSLC